MNAEDLLIALTVTHGYDLVSIGYTMDQPGCFCWYLSFAVNTEQPTELTADTLNELLVKAEAMLAEWRRP